MFFSRTSAIGHTTNFRPTSLVQSTSNIEVLVSQNDSFGSAVVARALGDNFPEQPHCFYSGLTAVKFPRK